MQRWELTPSASPFDCAAPKHLAACLQEAAEDASAVLVANRSGAVLGPHTILKEDHFPGCQSPHLPPSIPGVPNFRGVGVR